MALAVERDLSQVLCPMMLLVVLVRCLLASACHVAFNAVISLTLAQVN
jgi:hypothetical protein